MAKTFTSLITCECGYNYRFINERGVSKYVCSGYSKKLEGACAKRIILEEEILLSIVQIYCNRNKIELVGDNKFMKSIIERINIDTDHNIIIKYKNGENGIYSPNRVQI